MLLCFLFLIYIVTICPTTFNLYLSFLLIHLFSLKIFKHTLIYTQNIMITFNFFGRMFFHLLPTLHEISIFPHALGTLVWKATSFSTVLLFKFIQVYICVFSLPLAMHSLPSLMVWQFFSWSIMIPNSDSGLIFVSWSYSSIKTKQVLSGAMVWPCPDLIVWSCISLVSSGHS